MSATLVVYRDAQAEDAERLAALARETFVATFGHLYPPEDLRAHCQDAFAYETQIALLGESAINIRLAAQGGDLVGYCQVGELSLPIDPAGRAALELHRLYLVERVKGAGVANALMEWALARMRERGAEDAYLGVYQENPRAQRFYTRHGFEIVGEYKFPVGATLDDEFIMRRRLSA